MKVRYRDKGKKVRCRECGKLITRAVRLSFKCYYPSPDLYIGNDPLFLCVKCLKTLRLNISAFTLLVNEGVNTK